MAVKSVHATWPQVVSHTFQDDKNTIFNTGNTVGEPFLVPCPSTLLTPFSLLSQHSLNSPYRVTTSSLLHVIKLCL